VAGWIDEVLSADGDEAKLARLREAVSELCRQNPTPAHSQ